MAGVICQNCGTEYSFLYDSHDEHDCVAKLREENARLTEKLARCVEALGEIRGRSLAAKTHEVGPLEAKGRLTRILELACAALVAAKGGE